MSGALGSVALARARVQLSAWGRHWADVDLSEAVDFSIGSIQTCTIADASMSMCVISGGVHEGRAAYRLVGGRGKWGQSIAAKSYVNDAGVKTSLVLGDAAASCGEPIADMPSTRMGPHFARIEGPASDVLHELAPKNWYIDFAGTTRIGKRPTTTYSSDAPRTHVDKQAQTIELAVESVAGLVPGVVVDGMAPATDVEYLLDPKRLTVRVWGGPAATSRRLGAYAEIVRKLTLRSRYHGVTEYRVVQQAGERLNLQIVRTATGFADLKNVPVRPGVAGCRSNVALGELVLVQFVDGDPSRPVVTHHAAADDFGWMPLTIELGGPLALGVARVTDTVQAGPFAGVITRASARVKAAP